MPDDGLYAALVRRGMTRRSFLQFSAAMAAALALPASFAPRIAAAVTSAKPIPVVWIRGQACGGNTEALLRTSDPDVAALLLDVLSVDYHESLLAVAGSDAQAALANAIKAYPNGYFAVIEGAIPSGASGAYCLVGGRPVADVVREVCGGALATIAVGSCACDGGAPAAGGNTTGASGVKGLIGGGAYLALPGCPVNAVNLAAVIVHYLTYNQLPPTDMMGRPLSAYGNLIHNQCERRPHFEFGEFATEWGDMGAQKGWCLYKLGCKGPETMGNCPTVRYDEKTSWNVRAGHGCIGCMSPSFWNEMGSAYKRLPPPVPFLPNLTVDMIGGAVLGGIAAVTVVHAAGMGVRFKRRRMIAARQAAAVGTGPASAAVGSIPPMTSDSGTTPAPGVEAEAPVAASVPGEGGGSAAPATPPEATPGETVTEAVADAPADAMTPDSPEER